LFHAMWSSTTYAPFGMPNMVCSILGGETQVWFSKTMDACRPEADVRQFSNILIRALLRHLLPPHFFQAALSGVYWRGVIRPTPNRLIRI
jgi:hypothetical protein